MHFEDTQSQRIFVAILLIIAFLGFITILASTYRGVGRISDSLDYVAAAHNLVELHALSRPARHFTRWPPMFPVLIALPGFFGVDAWTAIRYLNAFFFACDILLIGLMIRRCTVNGSYSFLGCILFLTAVDLIGLYSYALSEPPFFTFVFLGFVLLDRYFEDRRLRWLFLSSSAISLACLTRYVGVTAVAAAVLCLFIFSKKKRFRTWTDIVLFGVVSCSPLGLWILHVRSAANAVGGREVLYHPFGREHIAKVSSLISNWLNPFAESHIRWFAVICALVAGVLLAVAGWRFSRHDKLVSKRSLIPQILVSFIFIYVAFLMISISFFDAETKFSSRHLAMVHACVLVLFAWCLDRWTRTMELRKTIYISGITLLLVMAAFGAGAMTWVSKKVEDGHGYSAKRWENSPLIRKIDEFPKNTVIYSNFPLGVALHFPDRIVLPLPMKILEQTQKPNRRYESQVKLIGAKVNHCKAIVVWFNTVQKPFWIQEKELLEKIPPTTVVTNPDGKLYFGAKCSRS